MVCALASLQLTTNTVHIPRRYYRTEPPTFRYFLSVFGIFRYFKYRRRYLYCFYRATLCVSAVFAVARCPSVHPSVCLSVCLSVRWWIVCIHTAEFIVKFVGPVSAAVTYHSSFSPPAPYPIPRGTPSQGHKKQGGGKICEFRLKSQTVGLYEICHIP